MQKSLLERFISKYNLGGTIEVAKLTATPDGLKTSFISENRNVAGIISSSKIVIEDGEYGIFDTARFRSLLNVLGEDIKLKVVKNNNRATGLSISDDTSKVTYVLGDPANLPKEVASKVSPPFEVVIKLDTKFLTSFVKAKGALSDIDTFTVITNKDKSTNVVIGHSGTINTNRVSINVTTESFDEIDPISFSADYLKEILMANKEMTDGKLKISSKGLAYITFVIDGFNVEYYLVKIDKKD
jgi:hypothetical protein